MKYKIKPGDTLWEISQEHDVSIDEIMAANPQIQNRDEIFYGKEIEIPGQSDDGTDIERLRELKERLERLKEIRESRGEDTSDIEQREEEIEEQEREAEPSREVREEVRAGQEALEDRISYEVDGMEFELPRELVEKEYFDNASAEHKAMLGYTWEALTDKGHDLERIINAFEGAAQMSEPYMGAKIRQFEDELARNFGYIIEDYEHEKGVRLRELEWNEQDLVRQERLYERRKQQLQEDLELGKEDIDLETQRAIKETIDSYDSSLRQTRDQMAQRGLTFSSVRSMSEQMLEGANDGIIEDITTSKKRNLQSLRTDFNRQMEDLEFDLESQQIEHRRGTTRTHDEIRRMRAGQERKLTQRLRTGEEYLGTDRMRDVARSVDIPGSLGFDLLGDMPGSVQEDRMTDILQKSQLFLN